MTNYWIKGATPTKGKVCDVCWMVGTITYFIVYYVSHTEYERNQNVIA
jgi:hypothetical protein